MDKTTELRQELDRTIAEIAKDHYAGEWSNEPNIEVFTHNGMTCMILRNVYFGHLCGYVAVPSDHYFVHKGTDIECDVHGGVTYSDFSDYNNDLSGLGNNPPAQYFWIGFDAAHTYDLIPFLDKKTSNPVSNKLKELVKKKFADAGIPWSDDEFPKDTYKNWAYIKQETIKLADFIAAHAQNK